MQQLLGWTVWGLTSNQKTLGPVLEDSNWWKFPRAKHTCCLHIAKDMQQLLGWTVWGLTSNQKTLGPVVDDSNWWQFPLAAYILPKTLCWLHGLTKGWSETEMNLHRHKWRRVHKKNIASGAGSKKWLVHANQKAGLDRYIARCHDIQASGDPDWVCWRPPAWANGHEDSAPMGWITLVDQRTRYRSEKAKWE